MPHRTVRLIALLAMLLLGTATCGGSGGDTSEIQEYLFTCPLTVLNATPRQIVQYEWALIEETGGADIVWHVGARGFASAWEPGLEMAVIPGPSYADQPWEPSLVWIVTFVDAADDRYEYTVRHLDCEGTHLTIEPGDAL